MEGEPLDEVQWRSPEWIQMFGLRTDNVLDYFSQSPFFDRGSNNQVLKMQSQFNEAVGRGGASTGTTGPGVSAGAGGTDFYHELRNMRGVEFVVAISREPDLWVIRKQTRLSPQETRPLATYFVIGENIYMAPSVHSVVTSRLLSTALCLNKALAKAAKLPGFSPSQGYFYKNENNPISFASSAPSANLTTTGGSTGTPGASGKALTSRSVAATPATTSTPINTNSTSTGNPSSTGRDSTGGAMQPPGPNGLPLTAAAERLAFYNIDRALSYSVSNTTVYIDDPVLTTATATAASATSGTTGAGPTQPAQQVNPAGVAAVLSASPSSTDLKAKAAMNNQAAATVKRRRKPLR